MPKNPYLFSQQTIEEMLEYRKSGFTFKEIAEIVGYKEKSIKNWFCRNYTREEREQMASQNPKIHVRRNSLETTPETVTEIVNQMIQSTQPAPVQSQPKEKTLKDFQARDMIRHLYNMGYRIENNQLVVLQKVPIKINDIING